MPIVRSSELDAEIETTERLGGLLRSYRRAALLGRLSFAFPTTISDERVGFLLRSAIVLERYFATADEVRLDLDPKSGLS